MQFRYLIDDIKRMLGKRKLRIIMVWMSRCFWGTFTYRIDRSLYMIFGNTYPAVRILFTPYFLLIEVLTNFDIHYKADIKGGLLVLHPSLGVVVSEWVTAGPNLTLTGGNTIGIRNTQYSWRSKDIYWKAV